jgi:hypothetical protein
MTAANRDSLVCNVCHKALARGEQYLVRNRAGRRTTVHRHVCFPPRATDRQRAA